MRLLIVLATYNERENIGSLLDAIVAVAPDADVLVIDDNSPDGTADVVVERRQTNSRILLHRRIGQRGLGTAMIAAFEYAIDYNYDWLLVLDADWSHSPESIPALRAMSAGADVVIGSRYVRGGQIRGWPLRRYLMSRCVNFYARWMLGLPVRDCSGSFRLYRVDLLRSVALDAIISRGYSFFEEILFRLKQLGARFIEVPIVFEERRAGVSKINIREAFRAVGIILYLAWARKL
ncbi:MAG: polyprenol monophosphomannose synthase [Thermoguttaceae bacterium]